MIVNKKVALGAALLLIVAGVLVATLRSESNDPAARALRLSERIACPVCDGETVAESSARTARDIRADIARRISNGESDDTIMDYYRRTFEGSILAPSDSGIGLVAWGLPVAGLMGAGAALLFAMRRWRSDPRLLASDEDTALVESMRNR